MAIQRTGEKKKNTIIWTKMTFFWKKNLISLAKKNSVDTKQIHIFFT